MSRLRAISRPVVLSVLLALLPLALASAGAPPIRWLLCDTCTSGILGTSNIVIAAGLRVDPVTGNLSRATLAQRCVEYSAGGVPTNQVDYADGRDIKVGPARQTCEFDGPQAECDQSCGGPPSADDLGANCETFGDGLGLTPNVQINPDGTVTLVFTALYTHAGTGSPDVHLIVADSDGGDQMHWNDVSSGSMVLQHVSTLPTGTYNVELSIDDQTCSGAKITGEVETWTLDIKVNHECAGGATYKVQLVPYGVPLEPGDPPC